MEPELIADYENHVGEGPLWHQMDNKLYWVDIPQSRIFRYDPETEEHELFYAGPTPIGGYTIQENGELLLFMGKGAIAVLRSGRLDYLIDDIPEEKDSRFNDVIADPEGRIFCGTMPDSNGSARLYRLDTDGTLTKLLDGIGLSNGLGFTPDHTRMYYTDSFANKIYLFDYQRETGDITNQRVFVEPEGEGLPDGMTVDAEGYIWSAIAGGAVLNRYTPDGAREMSVTFPTKIVSSCAFGGREMDELYVTTIGGDNRMEHGPSAGGLFRLRPGVKGVPDFFSRVNF